MNRVHALPPSASLVVACIIVCGCGGGGASTPATSGPPPAPPPPQPQLVAQPVPQLRPAPAQSNQGRTRPGQPAKKEGPGGPTSLDFIIDDEHDPFVLDRPRGSSLRDQFVAFVPVVGAVKDEFEIVPPDQIAPRGQPADLPQEGGQQSGGISLPDGFTAISTQRVGPDQLPARVRCELDGSEMVYVPASVFLQGTDEGPMDCGPAHPAYVSGFYIDVTEVTLGQFTRFQQRQRELKRGTLNNPLNAGASADHPALGISWRDAELYAGQLGKELPTEAEWEKAARGPSSFVYPWGNGRVAWDAPRAPGQIDPVKSFLADRSVYGAFDMAGNAREWCSDWYISSFYSQAKERDGSAIRDPKGPSRAEIVGHHVVKGAITGWELWQRDHAAMREQFPGIGFRCVLHVKPGAAAKAPAKREPAPPARPNPPPRTGNGF